jgi:hypothetical protein
MLVPPSSGDWTARVDPTKLGARKFNTGKGAGTFRGAGESAIWTETPEQKRKRLQDEVLGVRPADAPAESVEEKAKRKREEDNARETRRRVEQHNAADPRRGLSLVEQHKQRREGAGVGGKEAGDGAGKGFEAEDDPSKRPFDYKKDMGLGVRVGEKQRRELLGKAKEGLGSRYGRGGYL